MSNEIVKSDHYMSELDYARKMGDMIVKSGKWQKEWNLETVAVLVMYAKDLGIHPVKALMNGFDIIQGKISMKPILMSDMIRKAGHSISIVKSTNEECILKGRRKDTDDECTIRFAMEDAVKAGIASKDSFKKWPGDMLYNRAMGRLGRMLFSDVIGGAYSDGEMDDIKDLERKKKGKYKEESLEEAEVDIQNIQVDITNVEEHKEAPNDPTVEEVHQALANIGFEVELSIVSEHIKYISIKKQFSEVDVIKSALLQTERFKISLEESLKKTPPATEELKVA